MTERIKLKILGPRVLLKPVKKEPKTKGGIYLPENAENENKEAEVIEIGFYDDKEHQGQEFPVKKGDIVIYGGYSDKEIEISGEKYVIVDVKDILAIVKE